MVEMNNIPNWEEKYSTEDVESMPWFYPKLDPDFAEILDRLGLVSGKALDLGCGPGTQAIALAERGFDVTATDISYAAIKKARLRTSKMGLDISFIQDDILDSNLSSRFDIAFDRGCFHVFSPEKMKLYVRTLSRLVKNKGYLFLKCYSHLEFDVIGPYCFRSDEIEYCFNSKFAVLSIKDTVYYGTLNPSPKALICELRKI
ncbi:MAG: class I SAM-dependent methyltransferase [Candidatus Anammoxibacter sp.]